jgi:hypothetical protein
MVLLMDDMMMQVGVEVGACLPLEAVAVVQLQREVRKVMDLLRQGILQLLELETGL